jgi:hypothetical protein
MTSNDFLKFVVITSILLCLSTMAHAERVKIAFLAPYGPKVICYEIYSRSLFEPYVYTSLFPFAAHYLPPMTQRHKVVSEVDLPPSLLGPQFLVYRVAGIHGPHGKYSAPICDHGIPIIIQ